MLLCNVCQKLDVHGAVQSLRVHGGGDVISPDGLQVSTLFIDTWYEHLQAVHESSQDCSLCALVMKGWREDRTVVAQERLHAGDLNIHQLAEDMYSDIVDIEKYRETKVLVRVEQVTDADGFADNGRLTARYLLRMVLESSCVSSFDHTRSLKTTLRIISHDSVEPSCRQTQAPANIEAFSLPQPATSGSAEHGLAHERRPVSLDPLSREATEITRKWLSACVSQHRECTKESHQLPSRFLDVGRDVSSPVIHLRELKDSNHLADSRFVALSHCWGRTQSLCTTKKTLESHKQGIDMAKLPQSFKDAVAIVRSLSLRHLWIDSLCIIQDDSRDWQEQAAKMATVYGDAHLVIGAARGESDAEGFLGVRHPRDCVTVASSNDEPETRGLKLQLQPPIGRRWTDEGVDAVGGEPLTRRAWVLQESYLARRTLLYGSQQMFWECAEVGASEEGDTKKLDGSRLGRICRTANVADSVQQRASRDPEEGNKHVNYRDWHAMVEDYTNRSITIESDRLPALSGLAKATARVSGDEYLAGSWKSGLIEGLAWCGSQGSETLREPGEYIAPSWSWVSVAGPVQFPLYRWYDRARWHSNMSDFEPLTTYVGHELQLRDLDPEGRLADGRLKIQATLWPVVSIEPQQTAAPSVVYYDAQEPERSPFTNRTIGVRYEHWSEMIEFWIEGGFDIKPPEAGPGGQQIFVIFLVRWPILIDYGFLEYRYGLIVKKNAADSYQRLGFVDGHILRKVYSRVRREAMAQELDPETETLGIAGFPRAAKKDDWGEEGIRRNDLAYDPLMEFSRPDINLV